MNMILRGIVRPVQYLALSVAALLVLYPLIYTVLSTFLSEAEAQSYPPPVFPRHWEFGNLLTVLHTVPIATFIFNSFLVALAVSAGQLATCSLAAYAFTQIRFPGRRGLFFLFLSTMMIPWEVTIIPNYLTVKAWGWMDHYAGLTVPFLASAFGTFLLRQFFLQLPQELFEAARMDGCGHVRAFLRIALPLSRPALATLAVYAFLNAWNMYLWPLLITNRVTMRTVQIGIGMLQWEEFTSWNLVLAAITIVLIPSLLILVLGLRQLVTGLTVGAVKG